MKIFSWVLASSSLIVLLTEAVNFHRSTVCRQIAWKEGLVLLTRSTLSNAKDTDESWHLGCLLKTNRKAQKIYWQRFPGMKHHQFQLELKGRL